MWCIDTERLTPVEPRLSSVLDDDERERASRFVRPVDGLRYRIAHGALRAILGELLGVAPRRLRFALGACGKPRLRDGGPGFSLSHSGGLALVAVAPDREVGIDVEEVRAVPSAAALARRFFSLEEARAIALASAPGRDLRFMRSWTAMEAILKAKGTGFLERSEGSLGDPTWSVCGLAPAPGYVGAVAVSGALTLSVRSFG